MDVVFGIFCLIGFLGLIFGLPITALVKSANARRELEEVRKKLQDLFKISADVQQRLKNMEGGGAAASAPSAAPVVTPPLETTPLKEVEPAPVVSVPEPETLIPVPEVSKVLETPKVQEQEAPAEIPLPPEPSRAAPPPLSAAIAEVIAERHRTEESATPELPPVAARAAPPPLPPPPSAAVPPPIPAAPKRELNLEQFMGVKLFAWLGGLALFFGVVLFVKYAYDKHLITPAAQVAIGYVIGLGLLGGGVLLTRKLSYTVLAQTLCATGILVLYGDTYAAYSFHHLMAAPMAFGIMTLVTAVAFFLSVRLNALSISILGLLGGFLTPILCSTGEDKPWALFGYIALLDIGLLAVTRVKKWYFLASLGAAGTIIMQLTWFGNFFDRGHYDVGQATWTPILICVGFMALFLIAAFRTKQNETGNLHPALSAMALCGSALLFAFLFLDYSNITNRTWLLYGFVLLINAGVIAGIIINPRLGPAQLIIGLATFLHLAVWTTHQLKQDELGRALAVYFLFGLLHSVFPIVWQRLRPQNTYALQGAFSPWFPPLTILLMLLPVVSLPEVSFILWPAVLLVDALAIVVAVTTKRLPAVMAALVLTLIVAGTWLFKVPNEPASVPSFLAVVAGFAAFFAIAGCWLAQRFSTPDQTGSTNAQVAKMLPVMSAALPFALLIMATQRFPMPSPTPVFGIGLLLALLQLGLAKFSRLTILTLVSLGCMFALEISWHERNFKPDARWTALLWYLGINGVFAVYPFLFRKAFRDTILPWATAALAFVLQYLLVHGVIKDTFPAMAHVMGLVPALYAVPALLSLFGVLRGLDSTGKTREAQLAWFGGVSLLFITLIFPIQLDHQWLTISWALGRHRAPLALTARDESGSAQHRTLPARHRVRAPRAQSGRARLRDPQRHTDPQLVFLHLWPQRRGHVPRRAFAEGAQSQILRPPGARHSLDLRRHPSLLAAEHRDRRLLHAHELAVHRSRVPEQ